MEPFTQIRGVVLPIDRANIDTDAIIPKQYLKSIAKFGFGAYSPGVNFFEQNKWTPAICIQDAAACERSSLSERAHVDVMAYSHTNVKTYASTGCMSSCLAEKINGEKGRMRIRTTSYTVTY